MLPFGGTQYVAGSAVRQTIMDRALLNIEWLADRLRFSVRCGYANGDGVMAESECGPIGNQPKVVWHGQAAVTGLGAAIRGMSCQGTSSIRAGAVDSFEQSHGVTPVVGFRSGDPNRKTTLPPIAMLRLT